MELTLPADTNLSTARRALRPTLGSQQMSDAPSAAPSDDPVAPLHQVPRQHSLDGEAEVLAELARLRALVGSDEKNYLELKLDVLAARDWAIGAEAETGELKARNAELRAAAEELQRRLELLQRRLYDVQYDANRAQAHVDAIYASTTWRLGRAVTAPLRPLRALIRRPHE
jgi:hypothetical protein